MKQFLFYLRIAAVWALVLFATASLVNYAGQTKIAWDSFVSFNRVDDVSRWESRIAPIKAKIPPGVSRVGYVSEDPEGNEFILTQYALIPLVLKKGQDPEWMIGNDANHSGKKILRLLDGDTSEYDLESFGFGLYLIHRK